MARTPLAGRRIWLTGASSGIGRACALEFARRGALVAISARNTDALEVLAREIGTASVLSLPLDVTDRKANHETVQQIVSAWGGLDTVVFNAGTCEYVDEEAFDASLFERVHATNLLSVAYGMEACLPVLKLGKLPHLVGVSSSVAWVPLATAEAYGSSKAAMKYLLDAYRLRSEPRGLWVTGVYPGFVQTPLSDKNHFAMPFRIGAEAAARAIADGMEKRHREIHFPKIFTWPVKLVAHLPLWLFQPLVSRLVKVP